MQKKIQKTRRRYKLSAILFAMLICFSNHSAKALIDMPQVNAQSAALVEMNTGKLLCAKNAHVRLPMASTTKIMTAIIAIESCSLDEMVTVTAEAYGTEGSSMYLELNEKLSMRDLLYGLMLVSGNDAAAAIAVHIAGSKEAFADVMNAKAAELGLTNTHFVTPNGLHDDEHYTTAYELAVISAYAMRNDTFRTIVSSREYVAESGNKRRSLRNKNKTLTLYEGGNGVKTGYTSIAGRCLSFAAERNGMQLVGAVLHSSDTYGDAFSIMDYGFSQYKLQSVIGKGDVVQYVRLSGGRKNVLALCASEDIMIPVGVNGKFDLRSQVLLDKTANAPIEKGEEYGKLQLWENGRLLASISLYAGETIPENSIMDSFLRCARDWSA